MGIKRSKNKIKKKAQSITKSIPPRQEVKFSFKYFDSCNPKFGIDDCGDDFWMRLFGRLQDISRLSIDELFGIRSKSLMLKRINWEGSAEPDGFNINNKELFWEHSWEFRISVNEHGRVHGFLTGNTFCMVWLDPSHSLFPRRS